MTNTRDRSNKRSVDLNTCDKEQIHVPGSVQSFGALVAFNAQLDITRLSTGCAQVFGQPVEELLGKPLTSVLRVQDIEAMLQSEDRAWQIRTCALPDGRIADAMLHDAGDERYLDLIVRPPDYVELDAASILRDYVSKISKTSGVQEFANGLAATIRRITKLDRVKVYQFDSSWNGAVIAEARDEAVPSYLGLHFPQSDIPKQARELYQRNKVRVIADVNDTQSQIVDHGELDPLDLSFSLVRSVSEIHLQYLRNMDVHASMSISLYEGDRFWGLVACHHRQPRVFSLQEAALFESISDVSSNRLTDLRKVVSAESKAESLSNIQEMVKNVSASGRTAALIKSQPALKDLIRCTGSIVAVNGSFVKNGAVPDDTTIGRLVAWLERGREDIVAYDDLPERFSGEIGTYACGILAARLKGGAKAWLIWLRLEIIDEVNWAGDPYKPSEDSAFGARLYPRTSFELWREISRGKSAPWHDDDRNSARMLSEVVSNLLESGHAKGEP